MKELEALIEQVHREIGQLKFTKLKERDKDKCPNCDFDMICWR